MSLSQFAVDNGGATCIAPHEPIEPSCPASFSPQTDLDTNLTPFFSETSLDSTLTSLGSSPQPKVSPSPQGESILSSISANDLPQPSLSRRSLLPHPPTQAPGLSRLQCTFCEETFGDEVTLLYHKARAHRYRCELGCSNKGFPTERNRARHYGSKTHEQSRFMFQCGSCGGQFQGERRDNYLRHLKGCNKGCNLPYICGRDSHQTSDRVGHIEHVRVCKAAVGRKRKSPSTTQL